MIEFGPREAIREILVRGPNWVGDLVMTTPALRSLRAGFPKARITLQVRDGLEDLLAGSPRVDGIVPVTSYHAGPLALLREGAALRRAQKFDLGVCFPESFSSALLQRVAGVGCVVGYRRDGRGWLLHRGIDAPAEWGPRRLVARERFALGLVEALGCSGDETDLELFTTAEEESACDELLATHRVADSESLVVLAPGAAFGPSKCWPAESYAAVGDALARSGARVAILGAASESESSARVAGAMPAPVLDLTGVCRLGVAKALIRRARLVICNDAGMRHVAAAFGVPGLVFFGPTSVAKSDLNLEGMQVLETDVPCRPCYKRICPIDHPCLREISPDRVIPLAQAVLDRRA